MSDKGQSGADVRPRPSRGRGADALPHVTILMATCNGADFLPAQLESFADQDHGDWSLLVSDDGSSDDSRARIEDFARMQAPRGREIRVIDGPGRGATANFLTLLSGLPEDPGWIALSDQDDVWLPERLSRGLKALAAHDEPALYGSATWIVEGDDLANRRRSPVFSHAPSFGNALVQSIAGGNTMLLNPAGAALARDAAREALSVGGPVTHDWWLYQLMSGCGGTVVRDETPTVLYRQHSGNLFGTNRGARAALARLTWILSGELARWNAQNFAALQASRARLLPGHRTLLEAYAGLRSLNMVSRLRRLRRLGLVRQDRAGQVALWVAAALGKL